MKATPHRYLLLVLCLSILTGSVGMASPEMFCQMMGLSGSPVAAASLPDGCCTSEKPGAKEGASQEADCCELEVGYHKLEPVSYLQLFHFDFTLPPASFVSLTTGYAFRSREHTREMLLYADSSPPLYGRDLLRSLQLLLI